MLLHPAASTLKTVKTESAILPEYISHNKSGYNAITGNKKKREFY
jgi:hypothetical protein